MHQEPTHGHACSLCEIPSYTQDLPQPIHFQAETAVPESHYPQALQQAELSHPYSILLRGPPVSS